MPVTVPNEELRKSNTMQVQCFNKLPTLKNVKRKEMCLQHYENEARLETKCKASASEFHIKRIRNILEAMP